MMQATEDGRDWVCDGCALAHAPVALARGEEARCRRCATRLRVHPRSGPAMGLFWTLTALGLFVAAWMVPLLTVSKAGLTESAQLREVGKGFVAEGMPLSGALVTAFVVGLPLFTISLLVMFNLAALQRWEIPGWRVAMKLLRWARQWAMPEVFLLAILVAFLKVGDLAETRPGAGLWFLVGASFALVTAFQRLDRDNLEAWLSPGGARHFHRGSHTASVALLVAALILLIPANLLPIMEVRMMGEAQAPTIFGGVVALAQHQMWLIAAIVFGASVLVPLGKIGGLSWLLWTARRERGSRFAMRVHRVIDFIGRWSMLDVFLVGLLAGLIQFGQFAEIRPGPAAPAFAAAVILTVLAVEQFDPRELWKTASSSSSSSSSFSS